MKNNAELRAALNAVLARLDSDPKSVEEWESIRAHLGEAFTYAGKRHDLRVRLKESLEDGSASPEGKVNRPTKEMARNVAELAGRLVAEREVSKGASADLHQVLAVVLLLIDPGSSVNRQAYASDLAYAIIASVGR